MEEKLQAAMEFVRLVAEDWFVGGEMYRVCFFCQSPEPGDVYHQADCPVLKAQALLREQVIGSPYEKINQAIHVLATTDVFLNNETLVYLGWEENDGRLVYTFKTMPSQQKVILSFRTS